MPRQFPTVILSMLVAHLLLAPVAADPLILTIADYEILDSLEADRFEPSAAVVAHDGERVFLFNDKSLDLMPTTWHIGGDGGLTPIPMAPSGWAIDKIEGAARQDDLCWILTSCSKTPVVYANNWQLLAITEPTPGLKPEVVDYSVYLHAGVARFLAEKELSWIKFEGLALSPEPNKLLLGVREIGLPAMYDPVTEESEMRGQFVCGILELDLGSWGEITEQLWITDTCEPAEKCYGMGSLELDPDGQTLWMTMNYEGPGNGCAEVDGRLYQFSYSDLSQYRPGETLAQFLGVPVAPFEGKPECLSFLPDGRLLVVFDEDDDRKGGPDADRKYPLKSSQDYYYILDLE